MARRAIAVVLLAGLAGCAADPGGAASPYGDVATPGTAVFAIKQHYERRAREQNGMCTQMILEDALSAKPVEGAGDNLVLRVRYAYSARSGNTNRRFGCNGFGTRDFTLGQDGATWRVLAMSDPLA